MRLTESSFIPMAIYDSIQYTQWLTRNRKYDFYLFNDCVVLCLVVKRYMFKC